jgi:hypothetical protein
MAQEQPNWRIHGANQMEIRHHCAIPALADSAVLQTLAAFPHGASMADLEAALGAPRRTLLRKLTSLIASGRVLAEGKKRGRRYRSASIIPLAAAAEAMGGVVGRHTVHTSVPMSADARTVRILVKRPLESKEPSSYDRTFLDAYQPNVTFYLPKEARARLLEEGRSTVSGKPAGTYAHPAPGTGLASASSLARGSLPPAAASSAQFC